MERIEGLTIVHDFISAEEEARLIDEINRHEWFSYLQRRVQHYGYIYDYKTRKVAPADLSVPEWLGWVIERMISRNLIPVAPNQVIVNEYKSGQGISKHTDANVFGEPVISLSLGENCEMNFLRGNEKVVCELKRCDLMLLRGESRWNWMHEILPVKRNGVRISVTFRYV